MALRVARGLFRYGLCYPFFGLAPSAFTRCGPFFPLSLRPPNRAATGSALPTHSFWQSWSASAPQIVALLCSAAVGVN